MTDSDIAPWEPPASGADGVRAALSPLGELAQTPVSGHVGVFERVLTGLETVLASVEDSGGEGSGTEGPSGEGSGAEDSFGRPAGAA
ncbi:hypothetical protein [Microbispora amethystogenes]|uniref:Uncharacterized protein n=1 Tax=Microbispora amethystogenes TaxID=1427754 RepID=A0ABQ4FCK0_9ACTN|nr:hypothetical protein [Microbispora amethystogenes]GIH32554.1 hypothetical protein Mam01_27180 [Microbispora amethystogenes]